MAIVMGLDQHRAQITADWLDTASGEVSRARVVPADRAGTAWTFVSVRSTDAFGRTSVSESSALGVVP